MTEEEQSELSIKCVQLKMKSKKNEKSYSIDTLNTKGILDRNKLMDIWKEGVITDDYEYRILTNEIYKE